MPRDLNDEEQKKLRAYTELLLLKKAILPHCQALNPQNRDLLALLAQNPKWQAVRRFAAPMMARLTRQKITVNRAVRTQLWQGAAKYWSQITHNAPQKYCAQLRARLSRGQLIFSHRAD